MEKADGNGWTPLIIASGHGHLDVVRLLLEHGANWDKGDNGGYTSLHYAAFYGRLDIAKLLMVYGADLNARTNGGRLPIDMGYQNTEEIKQAIREEPRRRIDEAPGKRATEQDSYPNAVASSTVQPERNDKEGAEHLDEGAEAEVGKVAEEDEESEPSDDEDDRIVRRK